MEAMIPPPDGDRNKGYQVLTVNALFGALAFIFVVLRLYVRASLVKRLGLDDFFIVLSFAVATAYFVLCIMEVKYGLGRHIFYLSQSPKDLQQLSLVLKYSFISELVVIISAMFTRISICIFLLRIFNTKAYWRWGLYAMITFVAMTQIPSAVVVLVQCQPAQKLWDPTIQGKCWSPHVQISVGSFNGAISTLSDWVLATLPIFFLWNVQMTSRIKVGICCLMGMGFFSGVCAILRTVYLRRLASTDITWNGVDLNIWATLEELTGIVAACIPTLKPLFHQIKHGSLGSRLLGWKYSHSQVSKEGQGEPNLPLKALPPTTGPYSRISDKNYTEVSTGPTRGRHQGGTKGINKTTVVSLKQQPQDPESEFGGSHPVRMTV